MVTHDGQQAREVDAPQNSSHGVRRNAVVLHRLRVVDGFRATAPVPDFEGDNPVYGTATAGWYG